MVMKMPNIGAVSAKLKELVPNTGDFADTPEELEARGQTPPPEEAPAQTPTATPPAAPEGEPAPSAEAPGEAPPSAEEAPPPVAATPPPAPDPWADYEEIEYDDGDRGEKYKVRAPKTYAEKVKNGYARQSAMSRATGYLSKYKNLLEPLITQGRFDSVAQIIELGERQDQIGEQFRNSMYDLYFRAVTGKPMTFADQVAATQAAAQPVAQPEQQAEDPNDPLGLKALVQEAVGPVAKDAAQFKAWQEGQERAAQLRSWYDNTRIAASQQTYRDFAQLFPSEFTGQEAQDWPKMQQVFNYAKNAAWFEREGANVNPALMPVAMLKAKLEMDGKMESQAPPPASAALSAAQAAEEADRIAREATAKVAASVGAGSPSAPAARPPRREAPPLKDPKTGKPLTLQQIAAYYKE